MPGKKTIHIGRRKSLVTNLLVLEGISRSGKFLLANLINGLQDIEPVQGRISLEQIAFLERFGLIEKKTAQEMVKVLVDAYTYDGLIGRNLNFRRSDKSSIFNNPRFEELRKRTTTPDGDAALYAYYRMHAYSFFILHELLPNIKLFFAAFPNMKVVSLRRNPVDLVYSLYKRGYGTKIKDSRFFTMVPMATNRGIVPWYAADWKKNFYSYAPMDRVIKTVAALSGMYASSYKKLSAARRKQILFESYEDILSDPQRVVNDVSGLKADPAMAAPPGPPRPLEKSSQMASTGAAQR